MTALCLRILQAAWCTSTPSYSRTSSPRGNGPRCSARPTGAGWPRCSGSTSALRRGPPRHGHTPQDRRRGL